MTDPDLLATFIGEALGHQATLDDALAGPEAKLAAIRSIEEAATLCGAAAVADVAAKLQRLYEAPDGDDELAMQALRTQLAAALHDLASRRSDEPGALEKTIDEDLGLTDDELSMLQSVFRDEASSSLEGAAQSLEDPNTPRDQAIDSLMRAAHSIKGSASTVGLKSVADMAHRLEDRLVPFQSGAASLDEHLDALLQNIESLRAVLFAVDDQTGPAREQMNAALEALGIRAEGKSAPAKSRRRRSSTVGAPEAGPPVLRVDARKVDELLDLVGSLTLDQSRLEKRIALLARRASQTGSDQPDSELAELRTGIAALSGDSEALSHTGNELRRGLTELRMQTAASLFERLAQAVRAAARDSGKRVRVELDGGETRFDKAVADRISDALVHLVRNAVAHGIEEPAQRELLSKPIEGTVSLRANQVGDSFVLEVADDGSGIDPHELRRRLVETDRWSTTKAQLARDEEVLAAIFDAGMTSRRGADRLSGRGVGLDAVRATIIRLGGEIEVSSTPGYGTVFRMHLPLTTSVTQVTHLLVGEQRLAIPSAQVVGTTPVTPGEIEHASTHDGLPLLGASELLAMPRDAMAQTAVIIGYAAGARLDSRSERIGLVCNGIEAGGETVIKSIGPLLGQIPICAGATITAEGQVTFILDPVALLRHAHPDDGSPADSASVGVDTTTTAAPAPARVLLVDDSRTTRTALAKHLGAAGYAVDVAEDGERAWTLLGQASYDIVVTDIEMPGISGLELGERIQADPRLADVPVIIVTARPTPAYEERAERAGVHAFLPKPVSRSSLLTAVRDALD